MDCGSGEIFEDLDGETEKFFDEFQKKDSIEERQKFLEARNKLLAELAVRAPLSSHQYENMKPMKPAQRKGYMRNQRCVCGSGKKFKKCCWNQFT